jgi:glycoside/pentoside/hexuronide:cation symporter, GPH family
MKADAQGLTNGRLSVVEKVGFGLGDTASNILYQAWSFFLAKFYTDVYMLPPETAAILLLVTRGWDLIFDPTIGMIADRTQTRWGKFRPYLLWLAIPFGLLTYVMFVTPNWGMGAKVLYAYVTYILTTTVFTAVNIPYSSLMAVMTPNAKERTVLSQYRFFFAFLGQMLVTALMLPLAKYLGADPTHPGYSVTLGFSQALGYQRGMAVFAVIAVVLLFVTFATTRERVVSPPPPPGKTKADLHELGRSSHYLVAALSGVAVVILALAQGRAVLALLGWNADAVLVRVLALVGYVALLALVIVGASMAMWRGIRKTSFGDDVRDLSHNVPWLVLFASAIFFLIHNMIRNGSVLYYFDYVARVGKEALFTLSLGPLRLEFDRASIFLFFATLGMLAGVLVTMPCVKIFGKKALIIAITFVSATIELLFYFLPADNFTVLVSVNLIWALLAGATPVLLFAMYADVADYYEWKFKRRATGLVISGIMFAIKGGIAIGGPLTMAILAAYHYAPNQVQTAEAITGIKLLFSVIPAVLSLVYGLILFLYPINEAKLRDIESDLKARRAGEAGAP